MSVEEEEEKKRKETSPTPPFNDISTSSHSLKHISLYNYNSLHLLQSPPIWLVLLASGPEKKVLSYTVFDSSHRLFSTSQHLSSTSTSSQLQLLLNLVNSSLLRLLYSLQQDVPPRPAPALIPAAAALHHQRQLRQHHQLRDGDLHTLQVDLPAARPGCSLLGQARPLQEQHQPGETPAPGSGSGPGSGSAAQWIRPQSSPAAGKVGLFHRQLLQARRRQESPRHRQRRAQHRPGRR
ncbi:hypothetical protein TRV_04181, partial [Trichophyton verrucosum HKI 0517]